MRKMKKNVDKETDNYKVSEQTSEKAKACWGKYFLIFSSEIKEMQPVE